MDIVTMRRQLGTLLDELRPRLDAESARFTASDFEAGEEGMALNVLVTALTAGQIPVSPAQRDTIHEIIVFFDLDSEQCAVHPALADPDRAVERLTVLDTDGG